MTTKKIFSSFAVAILALSLAGCTTINNTTSTNKKPEQSTSSKVVKNSHSQKFATSSNDSQKENSVLNSNETNYIANDNSQVKSVTQPSNNNENASSYTQNQNSINKSETDTIKNNVLSNFLKANNMQPQSTENYVVTDLGSNNYQIEIRSNNNDNSVSHLNGLYKYNNQTNQIQQFNSINGDWK
ncbi:hypothetical protein L2520_08740 [Limosilactobacillus vaginalis]|uniref:Lipoprotein n=1 Tax=Limosilactobacillus vaginalis TaxID=1633 RepID=A0ABT4K971_9LACO|nr:hypothetical protein [Limosilactobacillus vaginalis]MCZ3747465.1 hypothetical protein [Limosilactobacillus vaginalis]MCZ3752448.1 hypothetical protein [Limosilactobacillus vaginalis]MCZ3754173.1 hypothetical protein [Limosilactobacillus vaginalis]MCZ3755902.1 hypothetical protein [Limosilactobacillus vaginalis]MCZ3757625.1 hypothetical protein [Limosilactobacillus vaginalis]